MNKILKRILIISGAVLGTVVLVAGSFVGYVFLSYNRIGDKKLEVDRKAEAESIATNQTYKVMSYNIGFGAYSQDYTFFLDSGYDENGNETCGHWSKARSKKEVIFNTEGAINVVNEQNPDFVFFQEVDTKSTRSRKVNQHTMITTAFNKYDNIHAVNFHTAFLPYPLYDMHGKVKAGLTTISKYQIKEAMRKEYTVSTKFDKFFDLDRCFAYSKIKVNNGKFIYMVNSHLSAYDEGGTIRTAQVKELNDFLQTCKDEGNYVIVGGDFNHDLVTFNPDFDYNTTDKRLFNETKKKPDWLQQYFTEDGKSPLIDGYKVVASDNSPSCRNNDIEWIPGKTFTTVVDGFIVSDNVKVVSHRNIKTTGGKKEGVDGFCFSDHEPVELEFQLL